MRLLGTSESSIIDASERRAVVTFRTLDSRTGLADKIRKVLSIVGVAGGPVVDVGQEAGSEPYKLRAFEVTYSSAMQLISRVRPVPNLPCH